MKINWILYQKKRNLLNVIISHLPDETINDLISQGIYFSTNSYKKPLFNYINFCKHLNLNAIQELVMDTGMKIIYNEIIHLFISENTKFTHLYIPQKFDYLIHL